MCGRIVREKREYAEQFGFAEFSETALVPRFNIGPVQSDWIVRSDKEGVERQLVSSWWGLVPGWAKDVAIGSRAFNARAETLTEKPMFRGLVGKRRCIIPASGFYEWRKDGKKRQPFYIHREDGGPIALAGLWDTWTDPKTGEPRTSHTIITTTPNGLMETIHDRMPVILDGEALEAWLDPAVRAGDVVPLLLPFTDGLLDATPVGSAVGNIRNEGPDLITPLEGAELC